MKIKMSTVHDTVFYGLAVWAVIIGSWMIEGAIKGTLDIGTICMGFGLTASFVSAAVYLRSIRRCLFGGEER